MGFRVGFFATAAGRSAPSEFLEKLDALNAARIMADIETVATYGNKAPVSMRAIKGYWPMWEIRTGGFRTFYIFVGQEMWVLEVCKKQDQRRGIERAARRMNEVQRGG